MRLSEARLRKIIRSVLVEMSLDEEPVDVKIGDTAEILYAEPHNPSDAQSWTGLNGIVSEVFNDGGKIMCTIAASDDGLDPITLPATSKYIKVLENFEYDGLEGGEDWD